MDLERDEFVVSFDAARVSAQNLLAASKDAGFPARTVAPVMSEEPAFFREAVEQARSQNKPLVIDFTAAWCEPCQRMLRETFPDPKVAPLLKQTIFVKVDTDEYPGLAQKFGAVGLPDLRLLAPDRREIRRLRDFQGPDAFATVLRKVLETVKAGQTGNATLTELSPGASELGDLFNKDVGNVRLLLILSPT